MKLSHQRTIELEQHTHFVIEGTRFCSIAEVARAARLRGFDGSDDVMRSRLRSRGAHTWLRLARPIDRKLAADRRAFHAHSRDDAADAARRVDERKAALAAAAALTTTEED